MGLRECLREIGEGSWAWSHCFGETLLLVRIVFDVKDNAWKAVFSCTQKCKYTGKELFPCVTFEEMVDRAEGYLAKKFPSTREHFYHSALERVAGEEWPS